MNSVSLPGSSRKTSRLGFGTSGLSGELTYKESMALLEAAFEAGIRHFDTAPLYGAGASEKLLGDFVVRNQSEITVTTKFGLMPPRAQSLLLFAKGIVRPLLRRAPGLKSGLAGPVRTLSRPPNYSREAMMNSLNASLRALRCEHIDLFLIHEPEETDISEDLRKALDNAVCAGLIGVWGVGGSRDKIDRIVGHVSAAPRVLQFEWSALSDRLPVYEELFCITYGAISLAMSRLKELLTVVDRRRKWSDEYGARREPRWHSSIFIEKDGTNSGNRVASTDRRGWSICKVVACSRTRAWQQRHPETLKSATL
jgi:D-threo-aldose 1-dehydrogenase